MYFRTRDYFSLARWGERNAAKYLQSQGLWIRDRNWRCKAGEIDIVAQDRGTLVIVEVKSRRAEIADIFRPEDAVDGQKLAQLEKLAKFYRRKFALDLRRKRIRAVRMDSIAIEATHSLLQGWRCKSLRWHKTALD